jgi:hypothetical protein
MYNKGEPIVASDFNTFRTDVLFVYDVGGVVGDITRNRGYGQIATGGASPIPSVVIGEKVKSVEWEAFRDAAQICSDHQGSSTTFPPDPELAVDEIIEAHEGPTVNPFDIPDSLITIFDRGQEFDAGSVSTFANILNSTRGTPWSNQLQHRFTATLPTVDDARYFFNSGGEIRFRGSRTDGSGTPQNASWTTILTNMGTMIMNYTSTFQSGGGAGWSGSAIGYFDLTTVFQQIAIGVDTSGGAYSAGNSATIEARTTDGPGGANGDTGRQLEFRILYTDGHTNPFADEVDGNISSDIDFQKATAPLTIQTPIFNTSVGLSSGS